MKNGKKLMVYNLKSTRKKLALLWLKDYLGKAILSNDLAKGIGITPHQATSVLTDLKRDLLVRYEVIEKRWFCIQWVAGIEDFENCIFSPDCKSRCLTVRCYEIENKKEDNGKF